MDIRWLLWVFEVLPDGDSYCVGSTEYTAEEKPTQEVVDFVMEVAVADKYILFDLEENRFLKAHELA